MTIASGKTYDVKDDLKKVGFTFNGNTKEWYAVNFDRDAWESKYCNLSWNGRKQGNLCRNISMEEV